MENNCKYEIWTKFGKGKWSLYEKYSTAKDAAACLINFTYCDYVGFECKLKMVNNDN